MRAGAKDFNSADAVTVALGIPMYGYMRMWHDGEASMWTIPRHADAEEYEGLRYTGAISTDPYDVAHYRETAHFDRQSSVVAVSRTTSFFHSESTIGWALFMKLKPVVGGAWRRKASWKSVEEYIIRAARGAQSRGEVVVVGRGPTPVTDGPSVLIGTSTMSARTYSVVSATPPVSEGGWARADPVEDRITLLAIMSDFARDEAASLAVTALREWGVEPFDVNISFVVPIELLTKPDGAELLSS